MNSVIFTGRITKDLELKYTQSQMAVVKFNIAVDRPAKPGAEKQADFPSITAFGKTAENLCTYSGKGKMVLVQGRIQTGSYDDKDGKKIYTTDVIADRVEFLEWNKKEEAKPQEPAPKGFSHVDEDIPF